jgi:dihydropteroate synthase
MGVLNVTPDSFSDGGRYTDPVCAAQYALTMIADGADIIDIGGESTRPKGNAYGEGAEPISAEEELRRVIPVIERIVAETDIPVSIDTYKAEVARKAIKAGAVIVNDISGFTFDPTMAETAAEGKASVVLMHIKGTPKTMQADPVYEDLFGAVKNHLAAGLRLGRSLGITQMMVDPGIGFGKTVHHNLRLLKGLSRLRDLGYPILIGPSRKSFIGAILNLPVEERIEGSLAACVTGILNGAHILRVHDVKQVKRAAAIADAIKQVAV